MTNNLTNKYCELTLTAHIVKLLLTDRLIPVRHYSLVSVYII